jgi:hypothetical protein
MPASSWIAHVKQTYQKGKSGGMSYKQAMVAAKKTWKKGGGDAKKKAPRKRRRKK